MNEQTAPNKFIRASILLIVFNIAGKGVGFFREIVFAGYFGLSAQFDIYLVGSVIPLMISTSVYYLGQNFFIPLHHTFRVNDGVQGANRFFTITFYRFLVFGVAIALILISTSDYLISALLGPDELFYKTLAKQIFLINCATIPFSIMSSVIIALLYSEFKFTVPTYITIIPGLLMIAAVFFLSQAFGIVAIVYGFLAGTIIQTMILVYTSRNYFTRDIRQLSRFSQGELKILLNILVIEMLGQAYFLVDRSFYSIVEKGAISAINYAYNIFLLPVSIISFAFASIIFPKIASEHSGGEKENLANTLTKSSVANIFIFLPVSFILVFLGKPIIAVLYQRGEFTALDTQITSELLLIYLFGLVFYSLFLIYNKALYGIKKSGALLLITVLSIILKTFLNFLLVKQIGSQGLAISTVIVILFLTISSAVYLFPYGLKNSIKQLFNYFLLTLANAVLGWIVLSITFRFIHIESQFVIILVGCMIFAFSYTSSSLITNYTISQSLVSNIPFVGNYLNKLFRFVQ